MVKVLITAGNYAEYKAYIMANRLHAYEYPYIGTYEKILGYANKALYVIGTARDNPEHNKIMQYAQMHGMTITERKL